MVTANAANQDSHRPGWPAARTLSAVKRLFGVIPARPQVPSWAVMAALFGGTFLFRILEPIFHNDHFEYFALAQEMLHGAVPGVDFLDPGRPLQYLLTAVGLRFGHQLLAEAVIAITLLSVGSVLVFWLAAHITRSRVYGVFAAIVVVAALPRLYSYPKVLVPALGLVVWARYVTRHARGRLVAVSLVTALGFYFRFDYALWIGCATVAGIIAAHWHTRVRLRRSFAEYALAVTLLCGPYLLFQLAAGGMLMSGASTGRLIRILQGEDVVAFDRFRIPPGTLVSVRPTGPLTNVRWRATLADAQRARLERQYGLHPIRPIDANAWQYVMTDVSPATLTRLMSEPSVDGLTNVDERGRVLRELPWTMLARWLHIPAIESPALSRDNAAIYLYGALFFTPFVAGAILLLRAVTRRSAPGELATLTAVTVLAALFNVFMIRGNIDSRLPDVIVPNVLLWVWLGSMAVRTRRVAIVAASGAVACSLLVAIDLYSGSLDHLAATDLLANPVRTARHLKYALVGLVNPLDRFAPPGSTGLPALVRYVNRCTTPDDRLLVLGYQPEFFFFADRRIAGGNAAYIANLGAAPRQQEAIVTRLEQQRVPVAILAMNRLADIESTYPRVKRYVDGRYVIAMESGFGEGRVFRVMVDRHLAPDHIDAELGLACFAR
jgi:hypothetical protein